MMRYSESDGLHAAIRFAREIHDEVDGMIAAGAAFRAIVTVVPSPPTGMVGIRRTEGNAATTETVARVVGFSATVGDEVLCVPIGGVPIVVGEITRSVPGTYTVDGALGVVGLATVGGTLGVTGAVTAGGNSTLLTLPARITSAGPASPTATNTPVGTYPGAGTTPPAITFIGSDRSGQINTGTGTGPTTGKFLTFTFATVKSNSRYVVMLMAKSINAGGLFYRISTQTAAGFDINLDTIPAASATIQIMYLIEEFV